MSTEPRYANAKLAGLCVACRKVKAVESRSMCAVCLEKRRLHDAYYRKTENGREHIKAGKKRRYYRQRARGVCTHCNVPVDGRSYCDRCHETVKRAAYELHKRRRAEVLRALGGQCAHCGFSDARALQIDHVIPCCGKGRRKSGHDYVRFLTQDVLPAIIAGKNLYQLLCANCNWIKRHENDERLVSKYELEERVRG